MLGSILFVLQIADKGSVEAWVICFILDVDIQRLDKVIKQKKQDIWICL